MLRRLERQRRHSRAARAFPLCPSPARPDAMTQSEAQPPLLRLAVTEGPQVGKALDSKKGTSLRVGRTAKSALYIKDPTISEAHAEVAWRDGAWAIRDLGSSNGTALNGRDLEESAWAPLKDGDVLRLGTTTVARVEVAAVASEQLTVEEFVLAECSQLEQRIRWVAGRALGCLPLNRCRAVWPPCALGSAATATASCCSTAHLWPVCCVPAASEACPARGTWPNCSAMHPNRPLPVSLPPLPRCAGRGRSRRPTSCGRSGKSRSRHC